LHRGTQPFVAGALPGSLRPRMLSPQHRDFRPGCRELTIDQGHSEDCTLVVKPGTLEAHTCQARPHLHAIARIAQGVVRFRANEIPHVVLELRTQRPLESIEGEFTAADLLTTSVLRILRCVDLLTAISL
jgi:hypothetical protein